MKAKKGLEFYVDKKGEHRWRVVAKNGRVLADSGEGYKRRKACERGAEKTRDIICVWLAEQYGL